MNITHSTGRPMAAYVCRGCGLVIPNKGAFWRCGNCGIRFDSKA